MPERNPPPPQRPETPPKPTMDWRPLIITLIVFALYSLMSLSQEHSSERLSYTGFKQAVARDEIAQVTLRGQRVQGTYAGNRNPAQFQAVLPALDDPELLPLLESHQVQVDVVEEESPLWATLLVSLLPWVLLFGLIAYSQRMMQQRLGSSGGGLFGFSRSKARLYQDNQLHLSFADVAGLDSAKRDLREVIEYLRNPDKFRRLGAKLPKGILMMGPPGTGKTLLAKATAAEAGVAFFSISGSEFVEMFVGVGAGRVRSMFEDARQKAPALIFIDEIDSVGRVRGTGVGGGNDEREQTLNQILAEMDGFASHEPIVVLAATNRPDVLDPALLRPGRFDRKVTLELPQKQARLKILQVHTRNKPLASNIDLDSIAARTIGFSGADLENLTNEAALHAAQCNQHQLEQADFDYAHDKILLGAERPEGLGSSERERIAYHESGHALCAWYLQLADEVSKITIIPRGRALGVTETLPREDKVNFTEADLRARLVVLLGGRCAEKLRYDSVSTGAADDLKQAGRLARRMVAQWGMSERLGPVSYAQSEQHPFLGMDLTQPKEFSDATARLIDEEVEALVRDSEQQALTLLTKHRTDLDLLTARLLAQETLSAQEVATILGPRTGGAPNSQKQEH